MRRVIGADDDRDDIGTRAGTARSRCGGSVRARAAAGCGRGRRRGRRPSRSSRRAPACSMCVGDALGEEVGERVLGAVDAHAGGRRVAEDHEAQPRGSSIRRGAGDDVVDVEARVAGQELDAAQPHELRGDDAGERCRRHRIRRRASRGSRDPCRTPYRTSPVDANRHNRSRADTPRSSSSTRPRAAAEPGASSRGSASGSSARPDARLVITRRAGQAEELAASAAERGHERIVVVGGDGTIQEVLNGVVDGADARRASGIVPVGSGNDLARSLGLPRDPARGVDRGDRRAGAGDRRGACRRMATDGRGGSDRPVASASTRRSRRQWRRAAAGSAARRGTCSPR